MDYALSACDFVEGRLPEVSRVAERMAERHLAGGMIGFASMGAPMAPELHGRSGGIMHIGFERPWSQDRSDRQKAQDMALVELDASSGVEMLQEMRDLKKRGCALIGFGPQAAPQIREHVRLCDVFFDNGVGAQDAVVRAGRGRTGRGGMLVNTLFGWVLVAEHVSALTRHGAMPIMAKSYLYDDGRAWWDNHFQKGRAFHRNGEYEVAAISPGHLGREFLDRIRWHLRRLRRHEMEDIQRAGFLIAQELRRGRKTIVAFVGHMPYGYLGKGDDSAWVEKWDMWWGGFPEMTRFRRDVPDGALTMRLGYAGLHANVQALFAEKRQRVILVTGEHTGADYQLTDEFRRCMVVHIDLGYAMGDSCVAIPGYPFRILPPSGIMQFVAYEAINAEVQARR